MNDHINQVKLILWQKYLMRIRNPLSTMFEVVLPIFYCLLIVEILPFLIPHNNLFIEPKLRDFSIQRGFTQILYSPNTTSVQKFMDKVSEELQNSKSNFGFRSENDLLTFAKKFEPGDSISSIYAINFDQLSLGAQSQNLSYSIAVSKRNIRPKLDRMFSEGRNSNSPHGYLRTGFLAIQKAIDSVFINQQIAFSRGLDDEQSTQVSNFYNRLEPLPAEEPFEQNIRMTFCAIWLPLFFVLSYLQMATYVSNSIIEEKESGVMELLKLMRLKASIYWFGWFVNAFSISFLSLNVSFFQFKYPIDLLSKTSAVRVISLLPHSSLPLLLLFYAVFLIAIISQSFFVASLVRKTAVASFLTVIMFFSPLIGSMSYISFLLKFFPVYWMRSSCTTLAVLEANGSGAQWSNLFELPNEFIEKPTHSIGFCLVAMLLIIVVNAILTWYLSNVSPGRYGLSKPLTFPFVEFREWLEMHRFCFLVDNDLACGRDYTDNGNEDHVDAANFEPHVPTMSVSIEIDNLRKHFGSPWSSCSSRKLVLKQLSMNIYENRITALLGPNGAGKTTLMSIITGMISASSGTVHINRLNVRDNLHQVRKSMGLCPQHDLHFPKLTIAEHLQLAAGLKGMTRAEARVDAEQFMAILQLKAKENCYPDTLSGGMRRKLSLGMAMVGSSKVLILDEPTTGLDPKSRREIWDILLTMRGTRTMLITTHFMEEADVLGDQIAIISNGELQCYGSPMFLKKRFGTGYELSVSISDSHPCEPQIATTIYESVPGACLKSSQNSLLLFNLPLEEIRCFSKMFEQLERKTSEWHIEGLGLSMTTLEDVYLRVTEGIYGNDRLNACLNSSATSDQQMRNQCHSLEELQPSKLRHWHLIAQQMCALVAKRWKHMCSTYTISLVRVLGPLMIVYWSFVSHTSNLPPKDPILLPLNMSIYENSVVYFASDLPTNAFSRDFWQRSLSRQLDDRITSAIVETIPHIKQIVKRDSDQNYKEFMHRTIAAIELERNGQFNGYYNEYAIHSPPIVINLISNMILDLVLKNTTAEYRTVGDDYRAPKISVFTKSFSDCFAKKNKDDNSPDNLYSWTVNISIALILIVVTSIPLPLYEHTQKIKRLHYISGVANITYWLSNLLFDMLVYLVSLSAICVLLQYLDKDRILASIPEICVFYLIATLFGFSAHILTYASVFLIKNETSGILNIFMIYELCAIAEFVKYQFSDFNVNATLAFLGKLIEFVPTSSFVTAFVKLLKTSIEKSPGTHLTVSSYLFGDVEIWKNVVAILFKSCAYAGLLFVFEKKLLQKAHAWVMLAIERKLNHQHGYQMFDVDVQSEIDSVQSDVDSLSQTGAAYNNFLVNKLRKIYWGLFGQKVEAVQKLSFKVKSGECFGLLGTNGAGKSTAFCTLTGDDFMSDGDAFIFNHHLYTNAYKYLSRIGYCPQYDPLYEFYSGRETLELYGRLRGLRSACLQSDVTKWLQLMGLAELADAQTSTYSGGNKRRVCAAIALIGEPMFVLLDEPTSGVDPSGRRSFWSVLDRVKSRGHSIVLSSHSMSECEALCDRLAIMDRGRVQCIGSKQHLKRKFCQGFNVSVKLLISSETNDKERNEAIRNLKAVFQHEFDARLKDQHQTLLQYQLMNKNIKWSQIFERMEKIRYQFSDIVQDYMVSETSLEQIFLSFSNTGATTAVAAAADYCLSS